ERSDPSTLNREPSALLACDSVALFVERAREVRPGFTLNERNAADVAEICRELEGIPLAIELAAAQVVEMSVAEVKESLGARLDALRSESPDAPERHRTLRAALDWSHLLLGEVERNLLAQLSI